MEQTPETVQEEAHKMQMDVRDEDEEQELLRKLIKKGVLELKPTLSKLGVRYVEAEETWKNTDSTYVKSTLKNLEKKRCLKSKFVDRVLTCPDCGSPEVYSKYTCPKCNSYNVEYTQLLEHMKCGYISSKDEFIKDSSLVCPGCQVELKEEAIHYRVIGNCYQCEKCGYRFDKPEIIHVCQKCGRPFMYQEAKYVRIYAYKITDETINNFRRDLPILEKIQNILTDQGFKVQLHPQILGTSGVEHSFDILAEKNETRLVIDISITGNKNDMISLLGKKVDVNPTEALIVDLSELDEITPLGKVYGIAVFKTTSNNNLKKYFENFLATLDSTETPKTLGNTSAN